MLINLVRSHVRVCSTNPIYSFISRYSRWRTRMWRPVQSLPIYLLSVMHNMATGTLMERSQPCRILNRNLICAHVMQTNHIKKFFENRLFHY